MPQRALYLPLVQRVFMLAYRTANACYKDVADIAGQLGQFDKAIEKFELVGANSLTSPLTRYSVKEYYFKAGLCQLAKGVRLVSTIS